MIFLPIFLTSVSPHSVCSQMFLPRLYLASRISLKDCYASAWSGKATWYPKAPFPTVFLK